MGDVLFSEEVVGVVFGLDEVCAHHFTGRVGSVLWTQVLERRADLSRLQHQAPDLMIRLSEVRRALDVLDAEGRGVAAVQIRPDRW
jgi:hypothetical protein